MPTKSTVVPYTRAALATLLAVLLWTGTALAQGGTSFYVPFADVAVGAVTAVQVCPAVGNRVGCGCTNTDTLLNLRYGDATVTITKGQQFKAGLSGVFDAGTGVWMIAESGTITVACTDERK